MDNSLTFDKDMLVIASNGDLGTLLYELKEPKLRPLAAFYNEPDALSVVRMAQQLKLSDTVINSLKEELNAVANRLNLLAAKQSECEVLIAQRHELLSTLKGIIDHCTTEHAEINGFGPQRMKASEVYDRIMWGTPNEGGAQ